jgi:hypothetical protein
MMPDYFEENTEVNSVVENPESNEDEGEEMFEEEEED